MSRTRHTDPDATRSCVVCRSTRPEHELLRLGELDGTVVVGRPERGRSAWVCVSRTCLNELSAGALSRGLRRAVKIDTTRFTGDLHQLAEHRVLEMVGLARRQRGLICGVDDVGRGRGLVLAASDLASRSSRKLGEDAREFVDGSTLGRAAGIGWLGAACIDVRALAERAGYWLALWYESRSEAVVDAAPELPDQAAQTGS